MDEEIPTSIGRYSVDRLLGAGAMGFVYLGQDPELARSVAIKTVRNLNMDGDALALFLERFRNEARAAARLQHPNIVQVYDVGEEDDLGPYLVFEYVAGSTLKQRIRRSGALTPTEVVRLAEEIGDALTVAHAAGVIHRDIKPDNLLITTDGQAKLADFGVARIPDAQLTREGQFLGTPCYAAPETLAEGRYGVHSDLFSFAAVLYEAASGVRAFPGDDALSVAHKVIHDEPVPPRSVADDADSIPASVETILMAALTKDADKRPESAAQLAAELRAAYEASGKVRAEDLGRPPSRRISLASDEPEDTRGVAFWAVVLGLLALGVAMVFAFSSPGDDPIVSSDAGTTPLDAGLDADASADAGDAAADAAADADADTGEPDQGAEEDAGEGDVSDAEVDAQDAEVVDPTLSPHDREEAAKNALDEARAAQADGDYDAALAAVERARVYDPGNPDVEELYTELMATIGPQ